MKEIIINVDAYNENSIRTVEGDNLSEVYKIYICKNKRRIDLTNKIAIMAYVNEYENKKSNILALNITNAAEGEIELPITNVISNENGVYACQIAVYGENNSLEQTAPFSLIVENNIFSKISNAAINSSDFHILSEAIKTTNSYAEKLKQGTENIELQYAEKLNSKMNRNDVVSMANIGQDVKEAMTKGAVPVVGRNSILKDNIVNKQIIPSKLAYARVVSKNLIDTKGGTYGYFVNHRDGGLIEQLPEYPMWVTDYIPVTQGEKYFINIKGYCAFYDNSYNFIEGYEQGGLNVILQAPSNACYFRTSIIQSSMNNLIFAKSNKNVPYDKFEYTLDGLKIFSGMIEDVASDKLDFDINNYIPFALDKNLFNKETITKNHYVNSNDGSLTLESSGYPFCASDFIEIKDDLQYSRSINGRQNLDPVAFYDSKKIFISGGRISNPFTPPTHANYIRVSVPTNSLDLFQLEVGDVTEYTPYHRFLSSDYLPKHKHKATDIIDLALPKNIFELHLPKDIYVAIGYPLEIYHNAICRCTNMNNYMFVWKLPKGGGSAFKDKLLLNPKDNLNKNSDTLTLEVYDNNYNLIDTQTSTVHYIKLDSTTMPQEKRKVLCLGDSLTDISKWREELYNRFNTIEGGKIEFLGTLGTPPYKHEGHSGWSLNNYLANSQEGWNGNYKIRVAQAPTITPKKQYKFDRKIFEYEKTEVENGVTWVYFNRISGGGYVTTSDSPCVEVDSSVSGDKTIEFTDAQRTSFNPFFNNSRFDCKYYSDTYLKGAIPNDVIIWLGTNGGKPSLNMKSVKTDVAEEMKKYKTIIDNIKSNWVNTKIFICYLHLRPDQNGMGNVDGLTCSKSWDNYIFEFNKQLFETFKDYLNVIFIPTGQTLDRVNNYYQKEIDINTRNTKKITVANDPVHPYVLTGFMQFADVIFGSYINNI